MACPGYGPCEPYAIDLSCCLTVSGSVPDPCILDGDPVPQPIIDNATIVASQILWAITGRQFGMCSATIRPCRKCANGCCDPINSAGDFYGVPWYPIHLADGSWTNAACDCQDECSCTKLSEIKLPYPTCEVNAVVIDGVEVEDTEYVLYNFHQLVRLNGESWPTCNDLSKPSTEEGTWSVTLTYGRDVPELVLLGAAEMACEIIKNCVGKPCKLPQRISSVTRQGVSVSFLDAMDFLDKGQTGLYFADLAARTYNPKGLAKKATIYSPDVETKWRVET